MNFNDLTTLVKHVKKTHPQCHCFLMLDSAQDADYIKMLEKKGYLEEYCSLFLNTVDEKTPFEYSPLLIRVAKQEQLMKLQQLHKHADKVILSVIITQMNMLELVTHLQKFLEGKLASGEYVMFRFFDPAIACMLPIMLNKSKYREMMQPLQGWWYEDNMRTFKSLPIPLLKH